MLACVALASSVAAAEGYVLGFGAEGDSADGRAITAFGDFSIGEKAWFSVTASGAETKGILRDNNTLFADIGIDYWWQPFGVKLGGSYWGDADILDSRDARASIYLRGAAGSISADYEKRNFEFDLQSDLLRGRTVKFDADGIGFNTRLALGDNVNAYLGGMYYDYSRNLRIQQDIDVLAFLSRSRLSMINSLIDDRMNAGVDFKFGLRSIDVTAGKWQTAIDGSTVNSYSIGFLTPIGDRTDAEFRVSFDDSKTYGRATAVSVYLYYFGGS